MMKEGVCFLAFSIIELQPHSISQTEDEWVDCYVYLLIRCLFFLRLRTPHLSVMYNIIEMDRADESWTQHQLGYNSLTSSKYEQSSPSSKNGVSKGFKLKHTKSYEELDEEQTKRKTQNIEKQLQEYEREKELRHVKANQPKQKSQQKKDTRRNGLNFGIEMLNSEQISIQEGNLLRYKEKKMQKHPKEDIECEYLREGQEEDQFHYKRINILLLGRSGCGKTSFVNCFLNTHKQAYPINITNNNQVITIYPFVHFTPHSKIQIRFIDRKGYKYTTFQDYMKFSVEYIEQSYKKDKEYWTNKINIEHLNNNRDERVHLCLFFLSDTINREDWRLIKKIQKVANVIPVISKGDHFSIVQIEDFKKKIEAKRREQGVNWFSLEQIIRQKYPTLLKKIVEGSNGKIPPFVIVSCREKQQYSSRQYKFIRQYHWGKVQLQNEKHNDFVLLKALLMHQMADPLIRTTSQHQKMCINNHQESPSKQDKEEAGLLSTFRGYVYMGMTIIGVIAALRAKRG